MTPCHGPRSRLRGGIWPDGVTRWKFRKSPKITGWHFLEMMNICTEFHTKQTALGVFCSKKKNPACVGHTDGRRQIYVVICQVCPLIILYFAHKMQLTKQQAGSIRRVCVLWWVDGMFELSLVSQTISLSSERESNVVDFGNGWFWCCDTITRA